MFKRTRAATPAAASAVAARFTSVTSSSARRQLRGFPRSTCQKEMSGCSLDHTENQKQEKMNEKRKTSEARVTKRRGGLLGCSVSLFPAVALNSVTSNPICSPAFLRSPPPTAFNLFSFLFLLLTPSPSSPLGAVLFSPLALEARFSAAQSQTD